MQWGQRFTQQRLFEMVGKLRHRWSLEEQTQRDLSLQRLTQACHDLRCQQRMSSERKEIIMNPEAFQSKHCGPDVSQHLFQWRLRGYLTQHNLFRKGRRRECMPVQF